MVQRQTEISEHNWNKGQVAETKSIHLQVWKTVQSATLQNNPVSVEAKLIFIGNKIYKTIILPVVLYGCETLSLTLRKKK
jgi:hypothetical protein